MSSPLAPEEFARRADVSRETLVRFEAYAALLKRWQARINLVSAASLADLWRRHFLDSAQVAPHLPDGPVLDVGTGAGFPGLVLAILSPREVHLVESDQRKCAFLQEAIRVTGARNIILHDARVETLAPLGAASIVARAAAPLAELLDLVERQLAPRTVCLFLKGKGFEEELTRAEKHWNMRVERIASETDAHARILRLSEVRRGRSG